MGFPPLTLPLCLQGMNHFTAISLRIENTAGPKKFQVVALHVMGDMVAIYDCDIVGFQDSLYTHIGRQYYGKSRVIGLIDFCFGNAFALLDECELVLQPGLAVVAASSRRSPEQPTGLIFFRSKVVGTAAQSGQAYLGRPWREYARTVYLYCYLSKEVQPEGWMTWNGDNFNSRPYYAEYQSSGPGAQGKRTAWATPGNVTASDLIYFAPTSPFLGANQWVHLSGIPFRY
eukprot:TRINITY_DN6817_c0_g3_i1.p1 TRINITY_DN6817_c0_g3~~TRINITY_DN6817_c0_g3_i1.p1  ORF type:complete len:230 (+),score=27.17 TRINITY_DN6817_c0_g3_i1:141-830(+)